MSLPGLVSDARHATDATAAWSVAAAPLVARALLAGASAPEPDEALPDAATLRAVRSRYGRFPGSFVGSGDGFRGLSAASVADEDALCSLSGAVFGVGLMEVDRAERRSTLQRAPEALRRAARRSFEIERSRSELTPTARKLAAAAWMATDSASDPRAVCCRGLARVFGDVWLDELRVMARRPSDLWIVPVERAAGRDELERWWTTRVW